MTKPATTLAETSWKAASSGWLPFSIAPFHFFPAYAAPGTAVMQQIRRLIELRQKADLSLVITSSSAGEVRVTLDEVALVIDLAAGRFGIERAEQSNSDPMVPGLFDPNDVPDGFFAEMAPYRRESPPEFRRALQQLEQLARSIWANQKRAFAEAFTFGHAAVVGRFGKIEAEFKVIEQDQWRYFDLNDDAARPRASSVLSEETIFSPLVMPIIRAVSANETAEAEAIEWLIERMQSTQNNPVLKDALREEAQRRWRDLSERGFNLRVWEAAKSSIPSNTYGFPGKPKKSNHLAPV